MASLAKGSGRPDVVPAFRSFIDQPGVPLVTAKLACDADGAALACRQSRYLPVGSRGNPQSTWQLPLCVRYGIGRHDWQGLRAGDDAGSADSRCKPPAARPG